MPFTNAGVMKQVTTWNSLANVIKKRPFTYTTYLINTQMGTSHVSKNGHAHIGKCIFLSTHCRY